MSKEQIKRIAKKVLDSNGKLAVSPLMIEEGYPETTAKNPQQITRSKTWTDFVEQQLPNKLLVEVHKEGLKATKRSGTGGMKIGIGTDGQVNDFGHTDIDEPDYAVRHKYLDTAYKLKGLYAPEKSQTVVVNVDIKMTDKEKALVEEFDEKLKKESLE